MLFLPSKTGANLQKKLRFPKLLLFELKEQFVKNASYDIASRLNSDYEMLTRPGEVSSSVQPFEKKGRYRLL